MARFLVIAPSDTRETLAAQFAQQGHEVLATPHADEAVDRIRAGGIDAVVADVASVGSSLAALQDGGMNTPLVALADRPDESAAAVRGGAFACVRRLFDIDEVRHVAERAAEYGRLRRENRELRAAVGLPDQGDPTAAVARNLAGKPLADIEKQVILSTLQQFKGHRVRTASALGIGVRTLGMKLKRWREQGEPIEMRIPHAGAERP
jgi:DNA-binding NtrC family response regulator